MQADLYETGRKSRNELGLQKESILTELSQKVEYNESVSVHLVFFHMLVVASRQQHLVHV